MASLSPVYNSNSIQPANVGYLNYQDLAESLVLVWPFAYVNTPNVVASLMDISTDDVGITVTMPDARQASVGQMTIIRNYGAYPFVVIDAAGNPICPILATPDPDEPNPGNMKYIYLTDNTTEAGTWGVINFGTGSTAADPAVLAGPGLVVNPADATELATNTPVIVVNGPVTIDESYRAKLIIATTALTITLPFAILEGGFQFTVLNQAGAGNLVTINPNGNDLNGSTSSITIFPDGSANVVSNTTVWYAYGRNLSTFTAPLSLDLGGTGRITPTPLTTRLYTPVITRSNTSIGPSTFWTVTQVFPETLIASQTGLVQTPLLPLVSWDVQSYLATDVFRINGTLVFYLSNVLPDYALIQVLVNNALYYEQYVASNSAANILYIPVNFEVVLGGDNDNIEVSLYLAKSAGMTTAYVSPYLSGVGQTISTLLATAYTGGS